jgi:hypothetical protein
MQLSMRIQNITLVLNFEQVIIAKNEIFGEKCFIFLQKNDENL